MGNQTLRGFLLLICRGCLHQFPVLERLEWTYVNCPHCGSRVQARRVRAEAAQ